MADKRSALLFLVILIGFATIPFLDTASPWSISLQNRIEITAFEVHSALTDGQFPVRWFPHANRGFGSPFPLFESPSFYEFSVLLPGKDVLGKVEAATVIFIIIGSTGMFVLGRCLANAWAGCLAASLFLYAPFQIGQNMLFGDFSGYMASALLPWAFICGYKSQSHHLYLLLFVLFAALTCCADLTGTSAVIVLPLVLLSVRKIAIFSRYSLTLVLCVVFALLISSAFWAPGFFETASDEVLSAVSFKEKAAEFDKHYLYPSQWFAHKWGDGISKEGADDSAPFQLGIIAWFLTFTAVSGVAGRFFVSCQRTIIPVILLLIIMFLTTPLSKEIWHALPQLMTVNRPWRIQWIALFLMIIFSISVFKGLTRIQSSIAAIALSILMITTNGSFYMGQGIPSITDNVRKASVDESACGNAEWLDPIQCDLKHGSKIIPFRMNVTSGDCRIVEYKEDSSRRICFDVDARTDSTITTAIGYFPGWKVVLDERRNIDIDAAICDPIMFKIPSGNHQIDIFYGGTLLMQITDGLSLIFSVLFLTMIIYNFTRHFFFRTRQIRRRDQVL